MTMPNAIRKSVLDLFDKRRWLPGDRERRVYALRARQNHIARLHRLLGWRRDSSDSQRRAWHSPIVSEDENQILIFYYIYYIYNYKRKVAILRNQRATIGRWLKRDCHVSRGRKYYYTSFNCRSHISCLIASYDLYRQNGRHAPTAVLTSDTSACSIGLHCRSIGEGGRVDLSAWAEVPTKSRVSCCACTHEETREDLETSAPHCAVVTFRYGVDDRYCSNADKKGS